MTTPDMDDDLCSCIDCECEKCNGDGQIACGLCGLCGDCCSCTNEQLCEALGS